MYILVVALQILPIEIVSGTHSSSIVIVVAYTLNTINGAVLRASPGCTTQSPDTQLQVYSLPAVRGRCTVW